MAVKKPLISKIVRNMSQAMSVKFNMRVYDLQRKGLDIIVLSLGEAFFDLPLFSFSRLPIEKGYHYSSSRGLPELRSKITGFYRRLYGVKADPEKEILVSAGSKILIYMCLRAVMNPSDEVIVQEPAWVSYVDQIKLGLGVPVMVPYYEKVANLKKYVTSRTRAIILNNPTNPSGKVYSKSELESIYDLARKSNLFILSDEAYSDFVIEEPFISIGRIDKAKERSIIINSLSKNLGMSGWRIGYIITNKDLINQILKLNQHLITCPTTLIEYYLIEYLDKILKITYLQIKKVVKKRAKVAKMMDKIGLKYLPGSGTFYFCVSIEGSRLNSERFAERLLDKYSVAAVPGLGYGDSLDKFLRVSVGTESIARIEKGLTAIHKLINETKI